MISLSRERRFKPVAQGAFRRRPPASAAVPWAAPCQRGGRASGREMAACDFSMLLSHLREGIWIIDADARTTFVNLRMAAMLGWTPARMLGKSLFDFMDAKGVVLAKQCLERRRRGIREQHEFEFIKKDATRLYASLETSPLFDARGRFAGALAAVTDITLRKKAEDDLLRSETKYRSLFESSAEAVMLLDERGFFDCNPAALAMLGLRSVKEFCGRHPADISPPIQPGGADSLALARERIRAALKEGSQCFTWTHKRCDTGALMAAEVRLTRMMLDGRPVLQANVRDVSERRQVEDMLRQSEARYRKMLATITDYIYTVTVAGGQAVATEYNAGCQAVTGYTPEEFAANTLLWIAIVPEDDRQRVKDWSARLLRAEPLEPLEHRILRKDGAVRWVRNTPVLHRDKDGILTGYDGIIQDITDAREALSERTRAETLTAIIEDAPSPIIVIDPGGRVTQCNRALSSEFGFGEQLVGASLFDFVDAPDRDRLREGVGQCLAAGFLGNLEVGMRSRKHGVKPALLNMSVLRRHRGPAREIAVIVTDISARKQAETKLEASAKALAASNREMEQFVMAASHDIQEPLRAIISFLQLLDRRAGGKLDEQERDYVRRVEGAAHRMQALIRDLLVYARIETRANTGAPACSLEAALATALENLHLAVEKRRAAITHDPLPEIRGNLMQFVSLFQNLIANAILFCEREAPALHIGVSEREGQWLLAFRDNGIGISPEHLGRLFTVFTRLHTQDKYPGSGVGLAICKKIVEGHRGRIWVESEPGKGSTFFVLLPRPGREAP